MDWNEAAIAQLRALWAEGHSTAEIGRRMGVTKNAIVGKAHRLDLPARPSPIRRDATATPRRPVVRRPPAVRPLSPPPMRITPRPVLPAPIAAQPIAQAVSAPPPTAPTLAVVRSFPRIGSRTCCWPLGEPGAPGFRFCEGGALTGKPYCAEHAAVAYVKARDRREDAA